MASLTARLERLERRSAEQSARSSPAPRPTATFVRQYRDDPVAFVHACSAWPEGQGPTCYQDEILAEVPIRKRGAARARAGSARPPWTHGCASGSR